MICDNFFFTFVVKIAEYIAHLTLKYNQSIKSCLTW